MDNGLDLEYESLLGEGAYGKVFLVKQQDGQQFAVKEIDLSRCDEGGRDQALKESALLSRLDHGNIIRYVESVVTDDCLYIVTEFCAGGDVDDYIQTCSKREHPLPESLISEWVLQIGEALKYLHEKKILHRDMKTKNLFLQKDFTVKLGDLGIAKVLDLNQSKADTFIGTPSYMSPELFTGKPYNHKTDIWGLGCCAYEMLTFKRAFQGKALWTIIREIKNGKVLELPDIYSLELRTLIQDMMSQNPNARPSAREIAQNDILHMGTSLRDTQDLPIPNDHTDEAVTRRSKSTLSGSFNKMLKQKGAQEDEKYRNSMFNVSMKLNTLRSTLGSSAHGNDYDTFVYYGDDADMGDTVVADNLEARNTTLDASALQQYTQQLDTFIHHSSDSAGGDSDSDYSTGGTHQYKDCVGTDTMVEVFQTCDDGLLKQYSQNLDDRELHEEAHDFEEELCGVDGVGIDDESVKVVHDTDRKQTDHESGAYIHDRVKHFEEMSRGYRDVGTGGKESGSAGDGRDVGEFAQGYGHTGPRASEPSTGDRGEDSGWESPQQDTDVIDTLLMPMKYKKYLGLKDTFQISSTRRRKDVRDVLGIRTSKPASDHVRSPHTPAQVKGRTKSDSASERKAKSETKQLHAKFRDKDSLSSSYSGYAPSRTVDRSVGQKSMSRTLNMDKPGQHKAGKMPVCDQISESVKAQTLKQHASPKKTVPSTTVGPPENEIDVDGVLAHLRDNLTSVTWNGSEADSLQQFSRSGDLPEGNKVKKKKKGFLKKQSQAKRSAEPEQPKVESPEPAGTGVGDVQLFTRAQQVRFHKDDENIPSLANTKVKEIQSVLDHLYEDDQENLDTQQILNIQQELAAGIGVENLKMVLEIMSLVEDDQEMKLHMTDILGPRLYANYETHLVILRILEERGVTNRTLNTHV